MQIEGSTILVTGANRGIGRALLDVALERDDPRIVPRQIDITEAQQVAVAAAGVGQLDVVINNAGIAQRDDLSDRSALEREVGTLVNNVSMMALAPLPVTPSYAVSKAAALNLTQSLRALLGRRGITVQAVLTAPTDTDVTRGYEIPKGSPQSVAQAILDGIEAGEEEIFPDPLSAQLADNWRSGVAKAFEHQSALVVAA
jgi:short-subunit dehydrogenase